MTGLESHCQIHENYELSSKCLLCYSVYCSQCCDEIYDNNNKCSVDVLGNCLLSDYVPPITIKKKVIFINPFYDYLLRKLVICYNVLQEYLKLVYLKLNYPKDILKYIFMLYQELFESTFVCICDHLDNCIYNTKKRIKHICCENCSNIQCLQDGKICKNCHSCHCKKCHMVKCVWCQKSGYSRDCYFIEEAKKEKRCYNSKILD